MCYFYKSMTEDCEWHTMNLDMKSSKEWRQQRKQRRGYSTTRFPLSSGMESMGVLSLLCWTSSSQLLVLLGLALSIQFCLFLSILSIISWQMKPKLSDKERMKWQRPYSCTVKLVQLLAIEASNAIVLIQPLWKWSQAICRTATSMHLDGTTLH